MQPLPGRPPAPRESDERGVILILTLFVLFLVIALIAQLSLGAEVAHQSTMNRANRIRMRLAIRSVSEEILTLLKDDASGEASGGFSSALAGPSGFGDMASAMGDGSGMGADGMGQGEEGEEGEEEEDASNSDSFEDAWAKTMRVVMDDIEVTTFVQDENAKFNVHLLLVEDEEQAKENYERLVRILDFLRDDLDGDLGETDARLVVDEILRWLEVGMRSTELPEMPRHSLEETDRYTMLSSLEELMLLDSIPPSLYYDQLREGEIIAAGLESVLTIWTLPAFEAAQGGGTAADAPSDGSTAEADLAASSSPAGPDSEAPSSSGDGFSGQDPEDNLQPLGEGGMEGVLEGNAAMGTRINLNTAHRAVLEGLLPSFEMPPSKVNSLLEWLDEIDEEALEERDLADEDSEDQELRESLYGEIEPPPKRFLKSLEGLVEVPGFGEEDLDEELRARLLELVTVQSDIFSVYLYAVKKVDPEWTQEQRYQEAPGHAMRMRAVVWRRSTSDGVRLVFLEPWREVPATRWRIPHFQRDLPVFEPPQYR